MGDEDTGSDDQFAVEDMRASSGRATLRRASSVVRALWPPTRTRQQQRVRRIVSAGVVLLALAVALAGSPGIRQNTAEIVSRFLPAPAPTLLPGANRFYLVPSPPGVEVSLDGHTLAAPPLVGGRNPLLLARGKHTFSWRSSRLPFQPLTCTVSVPPESASDTCSIAPVAQPAGNTATADVPAPGSSGYVITVHPSLRTLRQPQAQTLIAAVYTALATVRYSTTVQTGEHYFLDTPAPHAAMAAEPLRAVFSFDPSAIGQDLFPEPCVVSAGALPCHFPGQDCSQICTLPPSLAAGLGGKNDWIAAIGAGATWTYTTTNGTVAARDVRDPLGVYLVVLDIAWDGTRWQVTPIVDQRAGLGNMSEAACDTALSLLVTTTWGFVLTDPPPGVAVTLAPGASPADGCAIEVTNYGDPPPVFLERFGVLLTVNDQANNAQDRLPMASPTEQQLARQWLSLPRS